MNEEKYYLIYGLKSDFTYFEEFDDLLELYSFIDNFVTDNYNDDYKIIKGELIHE